VLMSGVSSDLAQAQLKVVRPAPYQPGIDFGHKDPAAVSSVDNAPVLPPIVPTSFTPSGGGSRGGSVSSTHGTAPFPTTPNGTPPTAFPSGTGGNQPGLVLGGTNPPSTLPPPPPTAPNPITALPGGGGPINGPGVLPPNTGPFVPGGPSPIGSGKFPPSEGGFRPFGSGAPETGLRAMPPGGIIGRVPSGPAIGEPSATRFGTQRVNPVGGVIGEPSVGTSMMGGGRGVPPGARGAGVSRSRGGMRAVSEQPYVQPSGRRSGRRDQPEDERWDPDNPWATAEGVDPVVLPPVEQQIDPGPAIGLG
jgi:hypothetical protein